MLPKHLRLPASQIPLVAKKGMKVNLPNYFVRKFFTNDTSTLFAISVSTKVSKLAVVRNRIKRVLRAHIQTIVKEANVRPGMYLIIVTNQKLLEQDDLFQQLAEIFGGRKS